jgi:Flp pilus assembly protein TadG
MGNTVRLRAISLRDIEGAEIAEAALVMPVVFIFLLGIIWFGRAFNIYSTITQAAQQGAIVAARPACATCPQPSCNWNSGSGGTDFPCDQTVANAVTAVMVASSLDPTKIIGVAGNAACTQSSATDNIQICREVVLNSTPGSQPTFCGAPEQLQVCGVTVSFQYPFQFYLPFTSLNLSQVILNAQGQSRMEN